MIGLRMENMFLIYVYFNSHISYILWALIFFNVKLLLKSLPKGYAYFYEENYTIGVLEIFWLSLSCT